MFQGTKPSKQDTHEFLHSIQKTLEPEFDLERFNRRFEKNWHDLDEELKAVAAMQGPAPQEPNLHKTVADIHGLLEALSVPIAETWAEINTTREKRLAEESNHRWLPSSVTFNAPAPPISGGNNLAAWGEPAKLVAPLGILGAPAKPATPSETGKAASMNPADFVDEPKDAPPAQSTAAHVYKRRHVPSRKPTKP